MPEKQSEAVEAMAEALDEKGHRQAAEMLQQAVVSDVSLSFLADARPGRTVDATAMHDDQPFIDAWRGMEAAGYMYGEDALENVHLGWRLAQSSAALARTVEVYQAVAAERGRLATMAEERAKSLIPDARIDPDDAFVRGEIGALLSFADALRSPEPTARGDG